MKFSPKTIFKYLPLVICTLFVILFLVFGRDVTPEMLLHYTPENPFLAALVLIAMYGLKSLSVFFPLIVLEVAGGYLFSPWTAILVNTVGVTMCLILPYLVGCLSGTEAVEGAMRKYPRFADIVGRGQKNEVFLAFFLRIISCLPGDIVSIWFGASGARFVPYLLASLFGTMPGVICATLLGMNITEPTSPMFWISLGLNVLLSVLSAVGYFVYKKQSRK